MLNNNLAEMCDTFDVTYEEIAKACNVSKETIIRIAKGKYNPTVTLALKIATYFDQYVDDVFSLDCRTSLDVFYSSKITNPNQLYH